jgi:hypothetical protein
LTNPARNVVWHFFLLTKLCSLLRCELEVRLKGLWQINSFIKLRCFPAAESCG